MGEAVIIPIDEGRENAQRRRAVAAGQARDPVS
jgi:hypothetical protein